MNILDKAKDLAVGAQIIKDWLGEGGVIVDKELSQDRADVCTGRITGVACPMNKIGFSFGGEAGKLIHKIIEIKNGYDIRVKGEKALGVCEACSCDLKTKVHVPMSYLQSHTTEAEAKEFPPICWQRTERNL